MINTCILSDNKDVYIQVKIKSGLHNFAKFVRTEIQVNFI